MCERAIEAEGIEARSLAPASDPGIPAHFAALGAGEARDGGRLAIAFSPHHGGDAVLAALAFGRRLAREDGFEGEVLALAPQWSAAARRRLAFVGECGFRFRALSAALLGGPVPVEPDAGDTPVSSARQLAELVGSSSGREIFLRALAALQGLAAKHGGSVRGFGSAVELVLLAQRVALLRAEGDRVVLETLRPDRATLPLHSAELAMAMDRLEGALRKRSNDRRVRGGEEGLRAGLLPALAAAEELRSVLAWPLGGSDPEVLDLFGVRADGTPVAGAARERLDLPALAAILDSIARVRGALPQLAAIGAVALRPVMPKLVLAARTYDDAVLRVLPALALDCALYDAHEGRGRDPGVSLRESAPGAPPRALAPPRPREAQPPPARLPAPRAPAPAAAPAAGAAEERGGEPARSGGYEEISLFDLDDDRQPPDGGSRRGRGRRGRRRRRRGRPDEVGDEARQDEPVEAETDAESPEPVEAAPTGRREGRGRRGRRPVRVEERSAPPDDEDDVEDVSDTLTPLGDEVPDLEEPEPAYDDEEELPEEIAAPEVKADGRDARPEVSEPVRPRRRAAIVAHASLESVFSALMLARDLRLVEGFWVYPQSELMTFFRSVATDLREDTPIHVVGFTASRETRQAAALYRGRLDWYDRHDWPPEDLEDLRETIGPERVHVIEGAETTLPAVLGLRSRRSRFSDKLVELMTGRFTQHDYERWGRLWWHRLGELARRSGERRADIAALLTGRPSDLTREAADVPAPPLPPEIEYVSSRDFRLVHFGGYTLVAVPVTPELDLHLSARVARERYGAQVSLAFHEGLELLVLGGEEGRGRKGFDLGGMVTHLAAKHPWVEALPDADHVARMRVRGLAERPERLDDVLSEIAMGRSILEG